MIDTSKLESRARRLAHKLDWRAVKSRWRKDSIDNLGGFQLIDARNNTIVDGAKFDLSAVEVIDICQQRLAEQPIVITGKQNAKTLVKALLAGERGGGRDVVVEVE